MIVIKAHYDGVAIIPDEPVNLPKGQPLVVEIQLPKQTKKPRKRSVLKWLAENAVDDQSLPADLAHQHDHYLYGTPKKPEAGR